MLHPLEVLGVGDQPLVHPVAVTDPAGLDLLDVGVDLLLLHREVVHHDAGVARLVVQRGAAGLQLGDLGQLRKVRPLVPQLVGAQVEALDVEQLQLREGVGFQRGLLGRGFSCGRSTGRCTAC
ncbi:hypothetical protein GCM10009844_16200 [Nocardioides koreensis]|uniref:Uncharacterized protein n=1 Tax=Nocardioides koreensis TaxID=433651 RepID=A0ABN2ZKI4_9ACTN